MESKVKIFMIEKIQKLENENNILKNIIKNIIESLENNEKSYGVKPIDLTQVKTQLKEA